MADAPPRFDPLLDESPLPFGAPAFDRIAAGDFLPAFRESIASARAEIEAIATSPEPPSFANTIVALERAGAPLAWVRRIFWTLASAQAVPAIRAIEAEVAAMLTEHGTATAHDPRLSRRRETCPSKSRRQPAPQTRESGPIGRSGRAGRTQATVSKRKRAPRRTMRSATVAAVQATSDAATRRARPRNDPQPEFSAKA